MQNVFVLSDPSKVRFDFVRSLTSFTLLIHVFHIFYPQNGNGIIDGKKFKNGKSDNGVPKEVGTEKEKPQSKPAVIETVVPMAWGGGRSFADVLKKEEMPDQRALS